LNLRPATATIPRPTTLDRQNGGSRWGQWHRQAGQVFQPPPYGYGFAITATASSWRPSRECVRPAGLGRARAAAGPARGPSGASASIWTKSSPLSHHTRPRGRSSFGFRSWAGGSLGARSNIRTDKSVTRRTLVAARGLVESRAVDDVVQEAAQVIGPLLSAGAGAAAHDLAEQAGSRVSAVTSDILARIRRRLTGVQPDVRTIEKALRAAIADGDVTETELRTFVNQIGGDNVSMRAGKNIYNVRDGINVHGDFHG
jgi:hypothetical protein